MDNELAKQRADLAKKKTPGYRAYNDEDNETADEFGMVCYQISLVIKYFYVLIFVVQIQKLT